MDLICFINSIYYELKNGGQINFIENQSIKEKLMQLEAFIDENENTMADRLVFYM